MHNAVPWLGLPMTGKDIFVSLETQQADGDIVGSIVELSVMEIYKEVVKDLLGANLPKFKKTERVVGTNIQISNATEALKLIAGTKKNRVTAKTLMNAESSRSHLIITIRVRGQYKTDQGRAMVRESIVRSWGAMAPSAVFCRIGRLSLQPQLSTPRPSPSFSPPTPD